jgi:hypothetical protein
MVVATLGRRRGRLLVDLRPHSMLMSMLHSDAGRRREQRRRPSSFVRAAHSNALRTLRFADVGPAARGRRLPRPPAQLRRRRGRGHLPGRASSSPTPVYRSRAGNMLYNWTLL